MEIIFREIEFGISIYTSCLIAFGVMSNSITAFICLKTSLRQHPTFIFVSTLSIIQTILLVTVELNGVFGAFAGYEILRLSFTVFKIGLFVNFLFTISNSFLMVINTFLVGSALFVNMENMDHELSKLLFRALATIRSTFYVTNLLSIYTANEQFRIYFKQLLKTERHATSRRYLRNQQ